MQKIILNWYKFCYGLCFLFCFYFRKKIKKYYSVERYLTDKESPNVYLLGVFNNLRLAIIAAKISALEEDIWVFVLPVPLKKYKKHIKDFEEKFKGGGLAVLQYHWKDHLGYNAKKWENTHVIYDRYYRTNRISFGVVERDVNEMNKRGKIIFTKIVEII